MCEFLIIDENTLIQFVETTDGHLHAVRLAVCRDCGQHFVLFFEDDTPDPLFRWATTADLDFPTEWEIPA